MHPQVPERTEPLGPAPRAMNGRGPVVAFFLGSLPLVLIWVGLDLWVSWRNAVQRVGSPSAELGLWIAANSLLVIAGLAVGLVVHRINPWGGPSPVRTAIALGIVPLIVASASALVVLAPSLITWPSIGVLEILLLPELATAAWLLVGLALASGFTRHRHP